MNDYTDREIEEHDIMIIWKCDSCGHRRQDRPGWNEGGKCTCGGNYLEAGESYLA